MLTKIRENIYLGDEKVNDDDLKKAGVTAIEFILPNEALNTLKIDANAYEILGVALHSPESGRINKPHVKDIACHIPKYMVQNGETVAVVGVTGLKRAAYVVARAVCEIENKSIYDIFLEMQELLPKPPADPHFDVGKAYL